jgi:arginyl-tRNA synthetase
MTLIDKLTAIFGAAFASLGLDAGHGAVSVSQRPELAQFQCNGALPAAKAAGKAPRDLAADVLAAITDRSMFAELDVAGPGFINITLTDEVLAAEIEEIGASERLGVPEVEARRIVIDYGGPNVAKELHVGHLRTAVIGESLKRVLRFAGHDVLGDVHLGDWGVPQGQLITAMQDREPGLPYFDPDRTEGYPTESPVTVEDLNEMYPAATAAAAADPDFAARAAEATRELQAGRPGYRALWQHFRDVSIAALREVYEELSVEFDLWYGESTIADRLEPMINRLRDKGDAVLSDGAVVIDVALPDDTAEIPPLMLVKSDGATLYTSWDLATVEDRVEALDAVEMIYIVDSRQALHFEQVFRAARLTGIVSDEVILDHAGNGTVNGVDGKPLKTREGDLPLLRDLIADAVARAGERLDENELAAEYDDAERAEIARRVGIAALKYGDLKNHRSSDYVFDLERFVSFEGKTGPYLLYGAVRIRSVLRKAGELGLTAGPILPPSVDAERKLMLQLTRLPQVVDRAIEFRAPNQLAEHAYELVAAFSTFYEACHILREEDTGRQASWLNLVDITLRQVELLLSLLAIEAPERM